MNVCLCVCVSERNILRMLRNAVLPRVCSCEISSLPYNFTFVSHCFPHSLNSGRDGFPIHPFNSVPPPPLIEILAHVFLLQSAFFFFHFPEDIHVSPAQKHTHVPLVILHSRLLSIPLALRDSLGYGPC